MSPFIFPINPWLLAGSALVGVPILIHLLNKRRFRIVRWAAMDLLLKAEQRNRRRLRLEDLIILLLRCLAVILLALLLARIVFDPAGLGLTKVKTARVEHIILLDDSPSMDIQQGNRSSFGRTAAALAEFARTLARERSSDTLTVILTSKPQQPLLNGQYLTSDNVDGVAASLESLKASALPARFDRALIAVDDLVAKDVKKSNRIVYIVSDFRQHDWLPADKKDSGGVPGRLTQIGEKVQDVILVNVGQEVAQNLAITKVQPLERNLIGGLASRFEVTVTNYGTRDVDEAEVVLGTEGGTPVRRQLQSLAPGQTESIIVPVQLGAEPSTVVAAELAGNDQLAHDNRRFFAGDVQPSINVLVVDGEPDLVAYRSETFYLKRALSPPGNLPSGVNVEVVDEQQFANRGVKDIQVLFLCNVFRLNEERTKELGEWLKEGGGLVVFPGDLTDPAFWNETLPQTVEELGFVRFTDVGGDISERNWEEFKLSQQEHPVVQAFAGEQNPFLRQVKVYRYWQLSLQEGANASVIAEFGSGTPAFVESTVGLGRVIMMACPADVEWSIWPADPSYLVTMQQLVHYLARSQSDARNLSVGSPLWHELDTSVYRSEAELRAPGTDYPNLLRAAAGEDNPDVVGLRYKDIVQPGAWHLTLTTHEGEKIGLHFAANIDAMESLPVALSERDYVRRLGDDSSVRFVKGPAIPGTDAGGSRMELARLLAFLALAALFAEQILAWHFRRRHQA